MSEERVSCDVLVVGAGPAGSCSAAVAASLGAKVILCERKQVPGTPVRCAEHIPALMLRSLAIEPSVIVQSVSKMRTILPDGSSLTTKAPGFIVMRDRLDLSLSQEARRKGAEVMLGTRVLLKEGRDVIARNSRKDILRISPKVIVGADGPFSTVGRWMESVNVNPVPAVQASVPLTSEMQETEVYFHKDIVSGYGWLFPKLRRANVGLGMRKGPGGSSLFSALKAFILQLEDEGKIRARILGLTAGWIPVRPLSVTVRENMLLVGDSAGHAHPITGAGVPQAVECGRMAGYWAAEAAAKGNTALLRAYEEEWKDLYWDSLERGYLKRLKMESHWAILDRIIQECWVAFRPYYG